jgi:hypothetical protein
LMQFSKGADFGNGLVTDSFTRPYPR